MEDQRLLGTAQRLVETGQGLDPEPAGQRRAGNVEELGQNLQPQAVDLGGGLGLQPQGRRRQGRQQADLLPGPGDGAVLAVVGERPGRARRIGDGDAERQAIGRQPALEVGQQLGLPAPQVGDAADVHEQAIGPIGGHGRREAHAPVHQGRERPGIRLGLGLRGDELGGDGGRIRGLLAHIETQSAARPVHGRQASRPLGGFDQREGARLCVGGVATAPVADRPEGRPGAEDACHQRPHR